MFVGPAPLAQVFGEAMRQWGWQGHSCPGEGAKGMAGMGKGAPVVAGNGQGASGLAEGGQAPKGKGKGKKGRMWVCRSHASKDM